jgi:murein DD-endopeptidase MepM/ murein hydrolase activator NlpD
VSARRPAAAAILLSCLLAGLAAHAGPSLSAPLPGTRADAEREMNDLDRSLGDLDARTSRLNADISIRERRTLARARAYARLARAGLLPVAGGFDAFVAHAMKLEGARRAIGLDLGALKQLRKDQGEVVSLRHTVASRRSLVSAQRDALAQAQSLIEEADDRRRAFERAFTTGSGSGPNEHVAIYGAGVTVHEAPQPGARLGFESLRGKLPFPLAGRAEVRPVRKPSASGPGLEFVAPTGSQVRAVHAGRVAFSGRYAEYGRLVMIDHGDRYFSVNGSLGTVDVKVGDEVASGAPIGTVGDEGHLYFELRHGNETIESKPWLGL